MKPLTIEQLRSLEAGDWVWLEIKDKQSLYVKKCEARSENGFNFTADFVVAIALYSEYGTKWLAYKNKEQAEAKSEIVELPISIGSTVWYVNYFKEVVEGKVSMLQQKADKTWRFRFSYYSTTYKQGATHDFQLSDIGKNVFTNKYQAERRLAELTKE